MVSGRVPRIQGLPLVKPPYSRITAIDLNTGDHAWMVPAGDTPDVIKENPALQGLTIPRTGSTARPVVMVTKTLVFTGEGQGDNRSCTRSTSRRAKPSLAMSCRQWLRASRCRLRSTGISTSHSGSVTRARFGPVWSRWRFRGSVRSVGSGEIG